MSAPQQQQPDLTAPTPWRYIARPFLLGSVMTLLLLATVAALNTTSTVSTLVLGGGWLMGLGAVMSGAVKLRAENPHRPGVIPSTISYVSGSFTSIGVSYCLLIALIAASDTFAGAAVSPNFGAAGAWIGLAAVGAGVNTAVHGLLYPSRRRRLLTIAGILVVLGGVPMVLEILTVT